MRPAEEVANWELFVWALGLLAGTADFVDVEDVFIKCFELAPKRFAWRSREDFPDYKKCSKALRDAEARRPRLLVKTSDGFKRQLAVEGQEWVRANRPRMLRVVHGGKAVQEPRTRPRVRMLLEVEKSDVYERWGAEGVLPAEKWKIAELLRCSPDSDPRIWQDRLQVLRAAANGAERVQLLEFLDELGAAHPDWFEEDAR